jgi:hypothetical protein
LLSTMFIILACAPCSALTLRLSPCPLSFIMQLSMLQSGPYSCNPQHL